MVGCCKGPVYTWYVFSNIRNRPCFHFFLAFCVKKPNGRVNRDSFFEPFNLTKYGYVYGANFALIMGPRKMPSYIFKFKISFIYELVERAKADTLETGLILRYVRTADFSTRLAFLCVCGMNMCGVYRVRCTV